MYIVNTLMQKRYIMLTIEQIRTALQDRRIDVVADSAGVSYSTVRDIRSGTNTNPTYETTSKLSDYLERCAAIMERVNNG